MKDSFFNALSFSYKCKFACFREGFLWALFQVRGISDFGKTVNIVSVTNYK